MPAIKAQLTPPGTAEAGPIVVQNPEVAAAEARMERSKAFYADTIDRGQRYTTFIIAGGYAAFFTVWNAYRPLLPRAIILLTGSMIGGSVLIFVAYEIWKAAVMSEQNARMARALENATVYTFDRVMHAEGVETSRVAIREARIWPYTFIPTVVLGVGAALLLVIFGVIGSFGALNADPAPAHAVDTRKRATPALGSRPVSRLGVTG